MFARNCSSLAPHTGLKRIIKKSCASTMMPQQRSMASHTHTSSSQQSRLGLHTSDDINNKSSIAYETRSISSESFSVNSPISNLNLPRHQPAFQRRDTLFTERDFSSIVSSSSWSTSSSNSPTDETSQQKNSSVSSVLKEMQEIIDNGAADFSLEELRQLAVQPCTPLSLADMYKYASGNVNSKNYSSQRLRNAQFLHKEIQIRIAHRAVDLLTLPHGLNKTQSVQAITHQYLKYLEMFKLHPSPKNDQEELEFTKILRQMVLKRNSIPEAISKGIFALKDNRTEGLDEQLQAMEKALYRFFNARTGLRLLAEHHILSCTQLSEEHVELKKNQSWSEKVKNETDLGCIQKNFDPTTEAIKVADEIMEQCRNRYGISPHIEIIDCTPDQFVQADFTYVPHHLQYMLAELLKNSCRATVKRYMEGATNEDVNVNKDGSDQGSPLPSIRVVVAKGAEDVTIKIADKGGGVPRSVIDKMWTFAHSTLSDAMDANKNHDTHLSEIDEFTGRSVSGRGFNIRGFGLPLARIYARYFGGELTLKSMEGYGVDAYLYLPVLGVACENLPKRVLKSPGHHDSIHDGNHHVYQGDSFSMNADEPWSNRGRHYSTSAEALNKILSKVAL